MNSTSRITIDDPFAGSPEADPRGRLQIRPGRLLGELLVGLAEAYSISPAEMMKRLAVMAMKGFDGPHHYDSLNTLHTHYRMRYGPKRESWLLTCELARANIAAKAEQLGVEFTPSHVQQILGGAAKVTKTGQAVEIDIEVPAD